MARRKVRNTSSFFNTYLISMVSISLVLYLLGLILILGFLGNALSHYIKENISFTLVLTDELQDEDLQNLWDDLESQPCIKTIEYVSKEQALLEMQHELGENPETFLGFNPFHASIEVKLKTEYAHPDSILQIEQRMASQFCVTEVLYRKDMMQAVYQNIRRIGVVLVMLLFVFVVIAFVLINNTVRLLIYSKRFIIYTMRLVGATSAFIRKPFIRNNMLSGLISGLLAIILLMGSLYYVKVEFLNLEDIIHAETMMLIYAIVLAAGIIISVIAAYLSVNRYLRVSYGKLYY